MTNKGVDAIKASVAVLNEIEEPVFTNSNESVPWSTFLIDKFILDLVEFGIKHRDFIAGETKRDIDPSHSMKNVPDDRIVLVWIAQRFQKIGELSHMIFNTVPIDYSLTRFRDAVQSNYDKHLALREQHGLGKI